MNSEQFETWLTDLSQRPALKASPIRHINSKTSKSSGNQHRKFLKKEKERTQLLINYIICNYEQTELVHPLIGHLLAIYYRFGTGRYFTLQVIPSLIYLYLTSLHRGSHQVVTMFEILFLAIYNEEILAEGPGAENFSKRVDLVRVPSIRFPSVYHEPKKLDAFPELTETRFHSNTATLSSIQIGPYPAIESIIGENRFLVLTRLVMTFGASLSNLVLDVVCKPFCEMVNNVSNAGFRFKESDFREKFLNTLTSSEVFPDLSGNPRLFVPSYFYVEALTIVNFCIFNGFANPGLRALDAIHQRGIFDVAPDILLVTNAMRDLLNQQDSRALIHDLESR